MSRKGNCYDNAPMESFWGTLKNESLSHYRFNNRDEAISVIREYIEIFSIVSVVTLVWGISPQPSGKNIIRWLLKKRTNGSVRYCQYTSYGDGHKLPFNKVRWVALVGGDKESFVQMGWEKNISDYLKNMCSYLGIEDADVTFLCNTVVSGNDSNLLIVFYVQIMPDDLVMQLHRF